MTPTERIKHAEDELIQMDPVLGQLIRLQRPISFEPRTNYFYSLCRSIISQQLSVASAAAIFARLEKATSLDPQKVVQMTDEQFRENGLSRQKISYIRDLATHFVENPNVYGHLNELSDEQVVDELTKVKGIGVWTAEMFLMFTMVRLDVFTPDDVGLQRAIKTLYGWDSLPPKTELEVFSERWRPYRTIACRHLWESLHNTPE